MRLSSSTGRRIVAGLGAGATVCRRLDHPTGICGHRSPCGERLPPHLDGSAKDQGHSAKSTKIDFGVLLEMRNAAGGRHGQELSDPNSASYGKWLTNAQFRAQFAPAKSDVSAVQAWLRSNGLKVESTLQQRDGVEVSGIGRAGREGLRHLAEQLPLQRPHRQANTSTLSLPSSTPAAVSVAISGVVGLDQGAC